MVDGGGGDEDVLLDGFVLVPNQSVECGYGGGERKENEESLRMRRPRMNEEDEEDELVQ